MPPVMLKLRRSLTVCPPRSMETAPAPLIEATLNEYAFGEPMCGYPSRLKTIRSIALASVTVPTVERGLEPIRSWSTMIAGVSQRALARAGDAGEHRQPALRDLDTDILEVVHARTLHANQIVAVGDVQRRPLRVRPRGHAHRVSIC